MFLMLPVVLVSLHVALGSRGHRALIAVAESLDVVMPWAD